MKIEETKLKGLFVIQPEVKVDERGFFMEVFRRDVFKKNGLDLDFVQVNHSLSVKKVLRGLHFQFDKPLGKLIRVINGEAFVVAVDIRKKSKTFKEWFGIKLSAENKTEMYLPPGFASGFCVLGSIAEIEYQFTEFYNSQGESSIIWNDKDINVNWPTDSPIISRKDEQASTLEEWLTMPESDIF